MPEPTNKPVDSVSELPLIEAVVFDMDGLMFNTEDLYDEVGDNLLKRRGHRFTAELKQKMMGLPGPKAFEVMRAHCGLADTIDVLQLECEQEFLDLLPDRIQMMPGLEVILDRIESLGLPKAVATSSHRRIASRALGIFDLESRFEFVLTGGDVENGKPNPDIYLKACSDLGVSPARTFVFEDSLNGSLAAAAAGVFLVVVPGHHSAGVDFKHANFRVDRLDDPLVMRILGNRS